MPTAANAAAGIVAEKATLRRLVEAGTRVVQYGCGTEGADVAGSRTVRSGRDLRRHPDRGSDFCTFREELP